MHVHMSVFLGVCSCRRKEGRSRAHRRLCGEGVGGAHRQAWYLWRRGQRCVRAWIEASCMHVWLYTRRKKGRCVHTWRRRDECMCTCVQVYLWKRRAGWVCLVCICARVQV